ncbi:MAG: alanine--tRNA ligase [Candidatus Staskawiczbacteria bacterium]|nr:alanine--tRNA ligase [Candidatus Staskawiczbacteria bacterium]
MTKHMDSSELRTKFLEYFKSKGHEIIPSASLIPENDPTVLFTTAGMHPLVPYLLGEKHPSGTRLTNAQKCIRTVDFDNVGDDTHNTFFEMLGNWSLGDYWKEDAIKWSFEFLTKELNIPLDRLAVSCFIGDEDAPKDEESAKIWESLGIKKERIAFLPKEDNWWGPAGETGPCGPDTEMFYWKLNTSNAPEVFDAKDENWVEIWNDVFLQYVKDESGNYSKAKQKNVDTGMGLERTLAIFNGKENIYETDLFSDLIKKVEELSNVKYEQDKKSFRIIVDHIRSATFIIGDVRGVTPSNLGQGYIVRRLIRRAIRFGKKIGIEKEGWLKEVAEVVAIKFEDIYPGIKENLDFVSAELTKEEEKFSLTLEKGLKEFATATGGVPSEGGKKLFSGTDAFNLYQTYGFPIEITQELAKEKGINVDIREFENELEKHQKLSRTASSGMFKGGLADASLETTKLHTVAHLMLAGLRKVLGGAVYQKGSNITAERLRFDFSHKEKMTSEQLKDVENFVNGIIEKDLPVWFEEMPLEKAKEINAMGVFDSKYGQTVKVYFMGNGDGNVSKEICGGPHVEHTGILGKFKIQKEESSSSGVRRIKATLE